VHVLSPWASLRPVFFEGSASYEPSRGPAICPPRRASERLPYLPASKPPVLRDSLESISDATTILILLNCLFAAVHPPLLLPCYADMVLYADSAPV